MRWRHATSPRAAVFALLCAFGVVSCILGRSGTGQEQPSGPTSGSGGVLTVSSLSSGTTTAPASGQTSATTTTASTATTTSATGAGGMMTATTTGAGGSMCVANNCDPKKCLADKCCTGSCDQSTCSCAMGCNCQFTCTKPSCDVACL